MARSTWLAAALLAGGAFAAWWVVGRSHATQPLVGAEDGASLDEGASSAEGPLLRAGPGLLSGRGAQAESAPYVIVVHAIDATGRPVPGVSVTARRNDRQRDPEDESIWTASAADDRVRKGIVALDDPTGFVDAAVSSERTDALGTLRVRVRAPASYELLAFPIDGLVGDRTWAQPTRERPVVIATIRMRPGSALAGRVVDAAGHGTLATVSGEWETAEYFGWNLWKVPGVATNVDGAFVFPAVPDGKGRLTVRIAGRGSFTGYVVPTPGSDGVTLRIPAGGAVRGRIFDAAGQPVAAADLTVTTTGIELPPPLTARGGVARGKAATDGTYRMDGVVAGRVTAVSVAASGFVSLSQTVGSAPWSGAIVKSGEELTLDLTLSRGADVKGRVLDRGIKGTETPVTNADVFLLGPVGSAAGSPAPRATAVDAGGSFRFEGVPLGRYVVYARSTSHFMPAWPDGKPLGLDGPQKQAGGEGALTALLVLSKEGETFEKTIWMTKGVPVSGVVRGPDGAPVADAKVRSKSNKFFSSGWQYGVQSSAPETLATSGPDGRFTIAGLAPTTDCVLGAHKPPLAPKWSAAIDVRFDKAPADVVLELEEGCSIAGRVVDVEGLGAAGVTINAHCLTGGFSVATTSGPDGAFLADGLGSGPAQVSASARNGDGAQLKISTPLGRGERRDGVELKLVSSLRPTGTISGVLVDADGVPVAERAMNANGADGTSSSVLTDGEGAFTFRGLKEGKATVFVPLQTAERGDSVESAPNPSFDVPSSGAKIVLPRKRAMDVVCGRVLGPDGAAVPLSSVNAWATETPAGSKGFHVGAEVIGGEFRLEIPAGQSFEIGVSRPRDAEGRPLSYREKRIPVPLVKPPTVRDPFEIRLELGTLVRGRVVSPDGSGVPRVSVSCSGMPSVSTDGEGAFEFLGLDRDDVTLSVQAAGKFTPPEQPTIVKAGSTDVVIRMEAALSIAGRVVDARGNPVGNGRVQVTTTAGAGRGGSANVNPSGTFRVENLPKDGLYDVSIQFWGPPGKVANHKPWQMSGVKAGTSDLFVRLESGEVIEGVVVDAEGMPVKDAHVSASAESGAQGAGTDDSGRFAVGGLEPGEHVLRASQWNGPQRVSLPVRAEAGAKNVRIVLPNQVKLVGRILADGDKSGWRIGVRPAGPITTDDWPVIRQVETGADGAFALDVPVDVTLDLQVTKGNEDRFGSLAGVKGGGADVTITLELGRSIEGTLEDADGNPPPAQTWVTAKSATWAAWGGVVEAGGRFRIRALPPGTYHLRAATNGRETKPALLDAVAGATGVRIRLPR